MPQKFSQPFTFDRVFRLFLTALAIAAGLYLLYVLKNILLPFFIAWLLAYLLHPIVRFLRRKLRLANGIAVITTLMAFFGTFFLIGVLLTPLIQEEIRQINVMIANYQLTSGTDGGMAVGIQSWISQYISLHEMQEQISNKSLVETFEYLSPAIEKIFSNTVSVLLGLTVVFMITLYLIFILLDYEKINEFWQLLIPPKYRDWVSKIVLDVETNMNTYFRHQALICLILAALYSIGFQLIGLPLAIVFGIVVGFMHMIPYLQVISFPPAVLLCWLGSSQSDTSFVGMIGLTILVFGVVQLIMDLILVPRIMGKAMGLNPAIILLSLSIWGFFFGIVGMIIAIPLTTLLLSYYKQFLSQNEGLLKEIQLKEKLAENSEE